MSWNGWLNLLKPYGATGSCIADHNGVVYASDGSLKDIQQTELKLMFSGIRNPYNVLEQAQPIPSLKQRLNTLCDESSALDQALRINTGQFPTLVELCIRIFVFSPKLFQEQAADFPEDELLDKVREKVMRFSIFKVGLPVGSKWFRVVSCDESGIRAKAQGYEGEHLLLVTGEKCNLMATTKNVPNPLMAALQATMDKLTVAMKTTH